MILSTPWSRGTAKNIGMVPRFRSAPLATMTVVPWCGTNYMLVVLDGNRKFRSTLLAWSGTFLLLESKGRLWARRNHTGSMPESLSADLSVGTQRQQVSRWKRKVMARSSRCVKVVNRV